MSPFARGMAMESRSMGFAGGMPHSANGAAPTGVVRTNFPDTWLWKTAVASKYFPLSYYSLEYNE